MQVKKFEAKTMKEALELVKTTLGPEAIILSVKDNGKQFGLVGQGSIEVTAAVSDQTLKKKAFVEAKLTPKDKERFIRAPARVQKDFIETVVNERLMSKQNAKPDVRPLTSTPYIQILDNRNPHSPAMAQNDPSSLNQTYGVNPAAAREKIRSLAKNAWQTVQRELGGGPASPSMLHSDLQTQSAPVNAHAAQNPGEIEALRREIAQLKSVIQDFKTVPQKFVSAHPGAEQGIPFELSFMFEKLTHAGITADIAAEILLQAQTEIPAIHIKKKAMVNAWVAKYFLARIQIAAEPFSNDVHVFMGPGGNGKTSSLVKMASHMVVNQRKRVAIVTTDSFKVGAMEQLRIYAQILNVPFAVVRSESDWARVVQKYPEISCFLVDFPGLSLREEMDYAFFRRVMPPTSLSQKIHLVLSANLKDSDAQEIVKRYHKVGFSDFIFTGMDESVQHGVIYSIQKRSKKPLHSFGIGPRIPEDFEEATKERVLDLILKLSSKTDDSTPSREQM